jgi:hypothetical protein
MDKRYMRLLRLLVGALSTVARAWGLIIALLLTGAEVNPRVAAAEALKAPTLTRHVAEQVLKEHIDDLTVENSIFTCRACFDPTDKGENTKAPVVSTHGGLNAFLRRHGYIRFVAGVGDVFTAKAKRSPYYVGQGLFGRFEGAGLRVAHLRHPKLAARWSGPDSSASLEYDFVPTPPATPFFRRAYHIRSTVRFWSVEGHWLPCVGCKHAL